MGLFYFYATSFLNFAEFSYIIYIESKRLGLGCGSSSCSVRKHRNLVLSVFFAPLSSLTYGRGVVGYKIGAIQKLRNQQQDDYQLPDRQSWRFYLYH